MQIYCGNALRKFLSVFPYGFVLRKTYLSESEIRKFYAVDGDLREFRVLHTLVYNIICHMEVINEIFNFFTLYDYEINKAHLVWKRLIA